MVAKQIALTGTDPEAPYLNGRGAKLPSLLILGGQAVTARRARIVLTRSSLEVSAVGFCQPSSYGKRSFSIEYQTSVSYVEVEENYINVDVGFSETLPKRYSTQFLGTVCDVLLPRMESSAAFSAQLKSDPTPDSEYSGFVAADRMWRDARALATICTLRISLAQ
jgi:hypothetical protein